MGSDANMDIGVTGDSSGAVAAFDALTAAQTRYFESLAEKAEGAGESVDKMSHAFAHSGVHLLNHELLNTIGLGGQARATMGLMSAGIGELASAFGTSMAVIAPWLLAIGAGVLLFEKFHKASEKSTEGLGSQLKALNDDTGAIKEYVDAGGRLSDALKAEAADTKAAADEIVKKITATTQDTLAIQQNAMAMYQSQLAHLAHNQTMEHTSETTESLDAKMAALQKKIDATTATLEANTHGYATWQEYVKGGTVALKNQSKAGEESQKYMDELSDSIGKQTDEYNAAVKSIDHFILKNDEKNKKLNAGPEKDDQYKAQFDAQTEAANAAYNDMETSAARHGVSMVALEKSRTETLAALQKNYDQKVEQDQRQSFGLQKSNLEDFKGAAQSVAGSFASGFSNSFAQMVVNGKNFSESMHQLFRTMAVNVISSLTEIAMKDVALAIWKAATTTASATEAASAQTAAAASGAAASTAIVSEQVMTQKALFASLAGTAAFADSAELGPPGLAAAPGVAATAYTQAFAAATGFDGIVDGPTHFLAGEAGQPESVKITPLGGSGGSSGSGGSAPQNVAISVVVQAAGVVSDINAFANAVGQNLALKIRGGGQLNLARS